MSKKAALALLIGALAIPLAVAAVPALAAGGPEHHHGGRHGGGFGFLQGVTLTDAQKTQIHQITQTSWTQSKPLMQQLRTIRSQIGDQLASTGAVNTTQLTALQQQAAQLTGQLQAQHLAVALQVRALLTPDQLAASAQTHQSLAALHAQEKAVTGTPNH